MASETQLTARIDSVNGVGSIALSGELDITTVPILEGHLAPFENDGVSAIMVDLRDLAFTDPTGIQALLMAQARVDASGRRLIVVGATPPVRRVFELTCNGSLLDDRDAAGVLGQFTGSRADGDAQTTDAGGDTRV